MTAIKNITQVELAVEGGRGPPKGQREPFFEGFGQENVMVFYGGITMKSLGFEQTTPPGGELNNKAPPGEKTKKIFSARRIFIWYIFSDKQAK